jgi:hypothetical protein
MEATYCPCTKCKEKKRKQHVLESNNLLIIDVTWKNQSKVGIVMNQNKIKLY